MRFSSYEYIRMSFLIYDFANWFHLSFLIYGENFVFFFISVERNECYAVLSKKKDQVKTICRTEHLLIGLNMELDLQSLFGLLCIQLYSLAAAPQLPPTPAFGIIYEGAIGQPR